jgi:hypothetical protein
VNLQTERLKVAFRQYLLWLELELVAEANSLYAHCLLLEMGSDEMKSPSVRTHTHQRLSVPQGSTMTVPVTVLTNFPVLHQKV